MLAYLEWPYPRPRITVTPSRCALFISSAWPRDDTICVTYGPTGSAGNAAPRLTELVYAALPVELRLVIVEIDTIAADVFQTVANLLSVFHDCGFASAFAQITAGLIFFQLRVILPTRPGWLYFFTKCTFPRNPGLS